MCINATILLWAIFCAKLYLVSGGLCDTPNTSKVQTYLITWGSPWRCCRLCCCWLSNSYHGNIYWSWRRASFPGWWHDWTSLSVRPWSLFLGNLGWKFLIPVPRFWPRFYGHSFRYSFLTSLHRWPFWRHSFRSSRFHNNRWSISSWLRSWFRDPSDIGEEAIQADCDPSIPAPQYNNICSSLLNNQHTTNKQLLFYF